MRRTSLLRATRNPAMVAFLLCCGTAMGLPPLGGGPSNPPPPPAFPPSPATRPFAANAPAGPPIIVGVWYQPADSFDKWKARGVNTLVGYENQGGTVTREQWTAAARAKGLFYITQASADLKKDSADPALLAWLHKDEPDGVGNVSPEQLAADYAAFKAAGDKPVAVVLDGRKMQWRPEADYAAYAKAADWLLEDLYPANYGDVPPAIPTKGLRLDLLKRVGGGKRLGSVIETSDQKIGVQDWTKANVPGREKQLSEYMRGPTPDEILQQFDMSRQHGATIFVLFPDTIGKNWENFDGQTPEQTAAVTKAINNLQGQPPRK